jgi:hypothetical protein
MCNQQLIVWMKYRKMLEIFFRHCSPARAMTSCRTLWPPVARYDLLSHAMTSCRTLWPPHHKSFLDHVKRCAAVGTSPLYEWSARHRDLYLTTHDTQQTNIHARGGIQTHDRSRRAAVDLHLRPRGHWDRQCFRITAPIIGNFVYSDSLFYELCLRGARTDLITLKLVIVWLQINRNFCRLIKHLV